MGNTFLFTLVEAGSSEIVREFFWKSGGVSAKGLSGVVLEPSSSRNILEIVWEYFGKIGILQLFKEYFGR